MGILIFILTGIIAVLGAAGGWEIYKRSIPRTISKLGREVDALEDRRIKLEGQKIYLRNVFLAFSKYHPAQHSEVIKRVEDIEIEKARYEDSVRREEKFRSAQISKQQETIEIQKKRLEEEREERRRREEFRERRRQR